MNLLSKFAGPGILLLLTLVFGVWLSLSGKPYNALLFNLHKLIALGMVLFAGIEIYQALKGASPQAVVIGLLVLASLSMIALFVTGALMSIGTPNYAILLSVHRIMIIGLVIFMAGIVIFLKAGIKA